MKRTKVLDKELKLFEKKRGELIKRAKGKYALVYEDEIVGTYNRLEDSFAAGYDKFGNVPFLVKEIREEDPVYFVG